MTRQDDPARWLESDDALLSPIEREALRTLAVRGPSQEQRARMHAAIDTLSSVRPPGSKYLWKVLATLGAGTLLLVSWLTWQHSHSQRPAATVARRNTPEPQAPQQASPEAPPAARSVAPPEPHPEAAPAPPPPKPRPRALVRRAHVAAPSESGAQPSESAADPTAELALLTPARQLLVVEPRRALSLAEQHEARFQHGVFVEEREFIRIEALLRLDQRAAAAARAASFRRAYPSSTYLDRLTQLFALPEKR